MCERTQGFMALLRLLERFKAALDYDDSLTRAGQGTNVTHDYSGCTILALPTVKEDNLLVDCPPEG